MRDEIESWAPLRVGRVPERIADRIVELIDAQQLQPGDRLPSERTLAAALGVSRPSLREALQSLQARGRVTVRHGAGVFVAEEETVRGLRAAMAREELTLEELFAMRAVLEGPAARWAAELQDRAALERLRSAFADVHDAAAAPQVDLVRLRELDVALHLSIVDAAGNRFLKQTTGVLFELLHRGMDTTLGLRLERARAEHERLVAAILDGDGEAAELAARTHIAAARDAGIARQRDETRASPQSGQTN